MKPFSLMVIALMAGCVSFVPPERIRCSGGYIVGNAGGDHAFFVTHGVPGVPLHAGWFVEEEPRVVTEFRRSGEVHNESIRRSGWGGRLLYMDCLGVLSHSGAHNQRYKSEFKILKVYEIRWATKEDFQANKHSNLN